MTDPKHSPASPQADLPAAAEPTVDTTVEAQEPAPTPRLEPTRYGDWELNGKCVDF